MAGARIDHSGRDASKILMAAPPAAGRWFQQTNRKDRWHEGCHRRCKAVAAAWLWCALPAIRRNACPDKLRTAPQQRAAPPLLTGQRPNGCCSAECRAWAPEQQRARAPAIAPGTPNQSEPLRWVNHAVEQLVLPS